MSVARINEWKKRAAEWKWRFVVRYVACTTRSSFRHKSSSFATFLRTAAQTYGPSLNDFCEVFFWGKVCVFLLPRRLMLRTLLNHCLSSAFKQEASKSQTRKRISRNHFISRDHQPLSEKQCPMPARRLMMGCFWFGLLQQNRQDLHALILC